MSRESIDILRRRRRGNLPPSSGYFRRGNARGRQKSTRLVVDYSHRFRSATRIRCIVYERGKTSRVFLSRDISFYRVVRWLTAHSPARSHHRRERARIGSREIYYYGTRANASSRARRENMRAGCAWSSAAYVSASRIRARRRR